TSRAGGGRSGADRVGGRPAGRDRDGERRGGTDRRGGSASRTDRTDRDDRRTAGRFSDGRSRDADSGGPRRPSGPRPSGTRSPGGTGGRGGYGGRTGGSRTGTSRTGTSGAGSSRAGSSRAGTGGHGRQPDRKRTEEPLPARAKQWGNVARRGAHQVRRRDDDAVRDDPRGARQPSEPPPPMDRWVRDDRSDAGGDADDGRQARRRSAGRTTTSGRRSAPAAGGRPATDVGRDPGGSRPVKPLPPEGAADIRKAADTATAHHREVIVGKMESAVAAYDRNRFQDAVRLGKQVAAEAPAVPAVRQLVGLAAYRAGRWREAVRQLEAYDELADDVEHIPALMDSYRALGRPKKVADLWAALRHQSPDPEVLAEARMVAAGMLGDRGDLPGAIDLMVAGGA